MAERLCTVDDCAQSHYARGWCAAHYGRWLRHGDPLAGGPRMATPGAPLAFIDMAVESATDQCIPWPYAKHRGDYGHLVLNGSWVSAHRLVLERVAGAPPGRGMQAAHAPGICHNPSCVNPRHLRWASPVENSEDRLIDGTANRGERNGNARLTRADVLDIYSSPATQASLARRYGVSFQVISKIKLGHRWGWLTGAT